MNNREVATLAWLSVALIAMLGWGVARAELRSLVARFLEPKVGGIFAGLAAWTAGMVLAAGRVGVWTPGQLGDAIFWYAGTGAVLLVRSVDRDKQPGFFARTAREAVGVGVVVEGFVNVGVLPLPAELVLVPFIALLAVLAVASAHDGKSAPLRKPLEVTLGLLGMALLSYGVARFAFEDDRGDDLRGIASSAWLTLGTLPFVFGFSLWAAYELAFMRMGVQADEVKPSDLRKAKLALVLSLRWRLAEVWGFVGGWPFKLAAAQDWQEARAVIVRFRADRVERVRQHREAAERLVRYAGVDGVDDEGRRLDQREFAETRRALQWLATAEMGWYQNDDYRRYRDDLLSLLRPFRDLPEDDGITLRVRADGCSWWAWRRTPSGWCFAIGAAGPPPDQWLYDGAEPPSGFPGEDPIWGGRFGIDARNW